jgi:O-antigen biosynthesis protein WbqP
MYQLIGKRIMDLTLSGLAIIGLSPILLIAALAIRREDGGPALFKQERVGRDGRSFTVFKFRSMPVNTGDIPSSQAGSVRITRVGKFIRRANIDELPQLFNIFRGAMSIVGPRPALTSQTEHCAMRSQHGVDRCAPGLTGLAQINSYDGMPEVEKVRWDAQYARSVSFVGDIGVILRTFLYLRKPPPTY